MKRVSLAILVLLLVPHGVHALTMEEAVDKALENNQRLREFLYRTEAQGKRVDSSKAPFWPEFEVRYDYERFSETFFFQTKDASTFSAELNYNLFRGFSDRNTLKSARSTYDASLYEQKATKVDVVLDVKRAYIRVLRTRKNLSVARESVDLLERQSMDAERFYRAGLTAKNEFLEVEVELASARQSLLQAETNFRIARKSLDRVIGVPVGDDEVIEDIGSVEPMTLDEEALSSAMLAQRSELKFLESQRTARGYARDAIKGGYLPSIDLSVTHSQYGETFAFEGRDELFDDDTRGMISLEWNLFDGFRKRNDIRAEEFEMDAITARIEDTRESLFLQLTTAVEEYRVSAGRIELAQKGVEHAEENYRINENQFRERVATSTDLLDARVFLTRARIEYNNAVYNLSLSLAALERVVEGPVTPGSDGGKPPGN
ncbi:MAG: TolC family protein [Deltaproteobacteria bacterium]|nr:TolC family protein [Deltaproteobacteria bacterium]